MFLVFTFDLQTKYGSTWWNGYTNNIKIYDKNGNIVCISKESGSVSVHSFRVFLIIHVMDIIYTGMVMKIKLMGNFIQILKVLEKQCL